MSGHDVTGVVEALALVLIAAKLGGHLAQRVRQPAVLGEILAGVLLGNLHHFGVPGVGGVLGLPGVELLAELGIMLLLFEVGLESTVRGMLSVGWASLLVACLGVAAPFALGLLVGRWVLPDASVYTHLFLGATLTATSVGISARVLKDLGRAGSAEGRIILGAAVIDDVVGLMILAVVTGIVKGANAGRSMALGEIGLVAVKAIAFLAGALLIGTWVTPRLFKVASRLRAPHVPLALGLALCFALAAAASGAGLAPMMGAFAAGLLLEPGHLRPFAARAEGTLEDLLGPITAFLVPVYFVLSGARVDLAVFRDPHTLAIAGALTLAAIAGKQACALGVVGVRADRLTVGLGMLPRGEVGLIFASIGVGMHIQGTPVLTPQIFAAVVLMVLATTLLTPPALRWRVGRLGPVPTT